MQVRLGIAVGIFLTLVTQFYLGVFDPSINQMVKLDALKDQDWLTGIVYDWVGGNEVASNTRRGEPWGFFCLSFGFSAMIAFGSYVAISALHGILNLGSGETTSTPVEVPVEEPQGSALSA